MLNRFQTVSSNSVNRQILKVMYLIKNTLRTINKTISCVTFGNLPYSSEYIIVINDHVRVKPTLFVEGGWQLTWEHLVMVMRQLLNQSWGAIR